MFQGFSEDTIHFLWGIRLNNHRDWFLEHKQDYLDHLYHPLKELGEELMAAMEEAYPDEGLQLKVTRIYRDVQGSPLAGDPPAQRGVDGPARLLF